MKKIISIMLCFMLLSMSALAEVIDLSVLTDEQLLQLKLELIDELDLRGIDSDVLYTGLYYVGRDIAAGRYIFDRASSVLYAIDVCKAEDDPTSIWSFSGGAGGLDKVLPMSLTLEDGNVLQIVGTVRMERQTLNPDWVP